MSQTVVVSTPSTTVVTVERARTVVVGREQPRTAVVVRGVPGPAGDASGAFLVVNRLSELATEPDKAAARTNLGLSVIDGGTFN